MKKTQRVLSFLLTAAMLLGLLSGLSVAFAAAATSTGSCGTSVNYLYSQGKLFIYGSGRMADYNLGGAPWSSYATQIKQVEISSNVQNIGAAAFANLTECTSYSIPQSVTEIGQYAFVFNTSLTTISLPGVLAVGSNAFVGCEKLSDASYPAKATIAQGNEDLIRAAGASASSSPSIPPESMLLTGGTDRGIQWKIYAQGTLVISPEQSGQSVYIPDYTTSGRRPWEAYKAHIEALIITDNILSIGDFAFADMPALSSVYIGSSTTMINMYAFKDCLALQTIEFSDKMKTISGYAFYGCYSLSEVITPLTVDRLHIGIGNEQLTNAMQIGITPGGAETPGAQASGYVPGTSLRWSIASGVLTVTSMSGSEAIPNYASAAAPWAPYARPIVSIQLNGITQIGS
ncbi:MAG: leucine-rich repeat domain-containing protein, partial [Clostridia bacterium]|nr:leucine-rich repeat domain-containing protein [Clostridia bacterium]